MMLLVLLSAVWTVVAALGYVAVRVTLRGSG